MSDVRIGDKLLLLTWLDRADRDVLRVHPRDDLARPLCEVFSTRSADRPNPIGVHRVTVVANPGPLRFQVRNLEALDGTPIVDVKTTLEGFVSSGVAGPGARRRSPQISLTPTSKRSPHLHLVRCQPRTFTPMTTTSEGAVSWGAIIAGAAGAAALSLVLFLLGTGLGFAAVSPWASEGISGTTAAVSYHHLDHRRATAGVGDGRISGGSVAYGLGHRAHQ